MWEVAESRACDGDVEFQNWRKYKKNKQILSLMALYYSIYLKSAAISSTVFPLYRDKAMWIWML